MTENQPAAGWYPADENVERYWDGNAWTEQTRPRVPAPPPEQNVATKTAAGGIDTTVVVTGLLLVASLIGLIMALQGASLLTGTGSLWTGVAIAAGAAVMSFVLKAKTWVKVVAVVAFAIAAANATYVEIQLQDMRDDIEQEFNDLVDLD